MKSRLWYACAVMMLVVSRGAFAEIVCDGGWTCGPRALAGGGITSTTEASSASADVDGFFFYWGDACAQPWCSAHTTIRAICEWRFWVYAYSEARLLLSTDYEPCYAFAASAAHASSSSSYPTFDPQDYNQEDFTVFVTEEDFQGSYEIKAFASYVENSDQDQAWFDPDEGVYGTHTAIACAMVAQYGYDHAYSHACSRAEISLRQTYP